MKNLFLNKENNNNDNNENIIENDKKVECWTHNSKLIFIEKIINDFFYIL